MAGPTMPGGGMAGPTMPGGGIVGPAMPGGGIAGPGILGGGIAGPGILGGGIAGPGRPGGGNVGPGCWLAAGGGGRGAASAPDAGLFGAAPVACAGSCPLPPRGPAGCRGGATATARRATVAPCPRAFGPALPPLPFSFGPGATSWGTATAFPPSPAPGPAGPAPAPPPLCAASVARSSSAISPRNAASGSSPAPPGPAGAPPMVVVVVAPPDSLEPGGPKWPPWESEMGGIVYIFLAGGGLGASLSGSALGAGPRALAELGANAAQLLAPRREGFAGQGVAAAGWCTLDHWR